jgi:hypothetical protein
VKEPELPEYKYPEARTEVHSRAAVTAMIKDETH